MGFSSFFEKAIIKKSNTPAIKPKVRKSNKGFSNLSLKMTIEIIANINVLVMPSRRSDITEAKLIVLSPVSLSKLYILRTSPPIPVGKKLLKNSPIK